MTGSDDALPAEVCRALDASSDRQLREIVHDAQRRLDAHPPLTEAVELQEDETFVGEDVDLDGTIRQALASSDEDRLREIVRYARHRLADRPALTDVIEARDNEELVRIDEAESYTTVVVERSDESGAARGRFAYMVQWEPHVEDDGKYKWHYLGRVLDESVE